MDERGRILVVKERDRETWDLPGGGIDHGETIEESIRRELYEEIAFQGSFTYDVIEVHDPVKLLTRDVWYIKIVVHLRVDTFTYGTGTHADEVTFMYPSELAASEHEAEYRIARYATELASRPATEHRSRPQDQ